MRSMLGQRYLDKRVAGAAFVLGDKVAALKNAKPNAEAPEEIRPGRLHKAVARATAVRHLLSRSWTKKFKKGEKRRNTRCDLSETQREPAANGYRGQTCYLQCRNN